MTTRQTIASPKPANIKINSPIPQKNLSHFRTHFPKNLSHPVQNRPFPPNLLKAIQMKQMKQMKQVKQVKQTASRGARTKATRSNICNFSSPMLVLVS